MSRKFLLSYILTIAMMTFSTNLVAMESLRANKEYFAIEQFSAQLEQACYLGNLEKVKSILQNNYIKELVLKPHSSYELYLRGLASKSQAYGHIYISSYIRQYISNLKAYRAPITSTLSHKKTEPSDKNKPAKVSTESANKPHPLVVISAAMIMAFLYFKS